MPAFILGSLMMLAATQVADSSPVLTHYTDSACTMAAGTVNFQGTPTDYTTCQTITGTGSGATFVRMKAYCTSSFFVSWSSDAMCLSDALWEFDITQAPVFWTGGCAVIKDMQGYAKFTVMPPGDGSNPCAGASVGGDPVTSFGGIERKFFLPIGYLTTLLETKDLILLASAFAGRTPDEQWLDRVVVYSAAGETVVDVTIRRDIASFERRSDIPMSYETIGVNAPWLDEKLLIFPANDDAETLFHWGSFVFAGQFDHPHNISLNIFRVQNDPSMSEDAPRREGVLITCDSLTLMVVSSSALEYYWEDQYDNRALQYSHLDFEIWAMRDPSSFRGLLPEVWGLRPARKQQASSSAERIRAQTLKRQILENML